MTYAGVLLALSIASLALILSSIWIAIFKPAILGGWPRRILIVNLLTGLVLRMTAIYIVMVMLSSNVVG